MEKIKLLLAGAGSIGRRHIRLLNDRDDVDITVVDVSEKCLEMVKNEIGEFKTYNDFDKALEEADPQVVVVATPHDMHSSLAIKAMEHGCDVFCEKPMADTLEECARMQECAKKTGRILNTGFMFRFSPLVIKAKQILDSGQIGQVLHFSSNFSSHIILLNSVSRHQSYIKGSLMYDCIHDVDLMQYLTGNVPESVRAIGKQAGDMELSSDPNVVDLSFEFEEDFAAHIHYDYIALPQIHDFKILGAKGFLTCDHMSNTITIGHPENRSLETISVDMPADIFYINEWEHFLSAVKNGGSVMSPPQDAIISSIVTDACVVSYLEDRRVDINEFAGEKGYNI